MHRKLIAEFVGTFWLVFGGCGSAIFAAAFPELGIGFVGVAFAFGLSVLTMAYAVGGISGGHFNPAVSIGLAAAGRFPAAMLPGYIISQVIGAIVAGGMLYLIASGKAGFTPGGFAANGYGEHSPGGYAMYAGFLAEALLTFVFLLIILGSIHGRAPTGFAPHRHRAWTDADPPGVDPDHQHLGQPGALDRRRLLRRGRMGARAALALLGGADRRRGAGRARLEGALGA